MYVYKISELIASLQSAVSDGLEYVQLDIIDDDEPPAVNLEYVRSANSSEEDMIDAVILPDSYSNW